MIELWQDRISEASFDAGEIEIVTDYTAVNRRTISVAREANNDSGFLSTQLNSFNKSTQTSRSSASEFRMQQTIAAVIKLSGIGLHSGVDVNLEISPAHENTGLLFKRSDLEQNEDAEIQGRFDFVSDTLLCTKVSNDKGASLGTVEHILSALRALEIDNAIISVDGPEMPVFDGSAKVILAELEKVGIAKQAAPRQVIKILSPISVGDKTCGAKLVPANAFELEFKIDFQTSAIGEQDFSYQLDPANYAKEIAPARTFGFYEDVEKLRSMGLAKGGSLDNAVVIENDKVLNSEGLRFKDEFVRHKILDAIGDLYLAGLQIEGKYIGNCAGHRVNNELLRALFDAPQAWTLSYQHEAEEVLVA